MKKPIANTDFRRTFLGITACALVFGATLMTMGCADDSTGPSGAKDWVGQIDNNHASGSEHTVTITKDQVEAGAEVTLSIKGKADHDHTVTLSADEVKKLKAGTAVHMKATTSGGSPAHTHTVHFM